MNIIEEDKVLINEQKESTLSQDNLKYIENCVNNGNVDGIADNYDLSEALPKDLANKVIDALKIDLFEKKPLFDLSFSTKLEKILLANHITREMLWEDQKYDNDIQKRIIEEIVFNNNAFVYLSNDFLPKPELLIKNSEYETHIAWPNEKLHQLRSVNPGLTHEEDQILFCNLLGINYNKPSLSTLNLLVNHLHSEGVPSSDFTLIFNTAIDHTVCNFYMPGGLPILEHHLCTFADLPFVDSALRYAAANYGNYIRHTSIPIPKLALFSKALDRPAEHYRDQSKLEVFPVTTSPILFSDEIDTIFEPFVQEVTFIYKDLFSSDNLEKSTSFEDLLSYLKEASDEFQLISPIPGKSAFDTGSLTYIDFKSLLKQPEVLQDALYLYLYDTVSNDKDISTSNNTINLMDYKSTSGDYSPDSFIKKYVLYPFFRQATEDPSLFYMYANPREKYSPSVIDDFYVKEHPFVLPSVPYLFESHINSFFDYFKVYVLTNLFEYNNPVSVNSYRSSELIAQEIVDSILGFSNSVNLVLEAKDEGNIYHEIDMLKNKMFESTEDSREVVDNPSFLNFNMILLYDHYRYDLIPSFLTTKFNLPRRKTSEILSLVDKKLEGFRSYHSSVPKQSETPYSLRDLHDDIELPKLTFENKDSTDFNQ